MIPEPGSLGVVGEIEATIDCVRIGRGGVVDFLVVWWDDGQRRSEWIHESECIRIDGERSIRIGFRGD